MSSLVCTACGKFTRYTWAGPGDPVQCYSCRVAAIPQYSRADRSKIYCKNVSCDECGRWDRLYGGWGSEEAEARGRGWTLTASRAYCVICAKLPAVQQRIQANLRAMERYYAGRPTGPPRTPQYATRWHGLVPDMVADHQAAWERRQRVLTAYESGATTAEISKSLNLGRSRIHVLLQHARRERQERAMRCPVAFWVQEIDNLDMRPLVRSLLR